MEKIRDSGSIKNTLNRDDLGISNRFFVKNKIS